MHLAGQGIVVRPPTARPIQHAFDPGGNAQDREIQLWRDVLANPSDWWDYRRGKLKPNHPDFRHKSSNAALWLDSLRKPAWVDSQLALVRSRTLTENGDVCGNTRNGSKATENVSISPKELDGRTSHEAGKHAADSSDATLLQNQEVLWKDFFSNPSEWWDNRIEKASSKMGPSHPDFRKKSTRQALWLSSSLKPTWVDHKLLLLEKKGGIEAVGDSSPVCREERETQMWKDLIIHPSEWWDYRNKKKTARHPDFRRKDSGQGLWLDSTHKPSWVDFQLATFNAYHKGLRQPKVDDEVQSLCKEGNLVKAMEVVFSMDEQGLVPTEKTFLSLLNVCKVTKASIHAKSVHALLIRYQVSLDGFLGQHLLFTLAKCGVLDDAEKVFHGLSNRCVITWTAMISGYVSCGKEHKALDFYKDMQEEGVNPDALTFVCLLKACGNLNDLLLGKKLHADILKFKCESDVAVGACLVDMFAKCGTLADAQTAFDGMVQHNVVSWTALLLAHIEHDEAERALSLFNKMKEAGLSPDERMFVAAFQACSMLTEEEKVDCYKGVGTKVGGALSWGHALHTEAVMVGFNSDSYIGNTLISTYGKTGHLSEAESVFRRLPEQTPVSWAAMLTAYVEQGLAEMALNGYRQMKVDGFTPNEWTIVAALRACCVLAEQGEERALSKSEQRTALAFGKELHKEAQQNDCDKDVFVGNCLLILYGICGELLEAETVFECMPVHNAMSYNAMLFAHLEHGQAEKVLWLYKQMQSVGVNVNERTLVLALQACNILAEMAEADQACDQQSGKVVALKHCLELHTNSWLKGLNSCTFVVSALVKAYTKCGAFMEAENVFSGFSGHDVISWNGMLTAYMEQGNGETVLRLHKKMQEEKVLPDAITLLCVLQACSKVRNVDLCGQIHFSIVSENLDSDPHFAKGLTHAYGCCGSVVEAQAVFNSIQRKTVSVWNALITAYVSASYQRQDKDRSAYAKNALKLCVDMGNKGMSFNEQTALLALQACCSLSEAEGALAKHGGFKGLSPLGAGFGWHSEVLKRGFESNVVLGSALVSMYGKCGRFPEAEMVFDGQTHRDLLSYNAMMSAYLEHGKGEKVLQLHKQIRKEGIVATDWMLICALQACVSTADAEMCKQIHREIVMAGFDSSLAVANTLMNVYGSCGGMADAQAIFNSLEPNVTSWTALVAAYARQGEHVASLRWYDKMRVDGFKPNEVTFLSVLSACHHGGYVDKAYEYFTSMRNEYGLSPDIEHYGIMLDLLGRAGDFAGVKNLLSEMPTQPDLEMWICLLGSCQKHGNVELGKQAFDRATQLQPKHMGAHEVVANIFADTVPENSIQEADRKWRSGMWEKYDERWTRHEQGVPLLWQEMAIHLATKTCSWQTV